MSRIPDGSYALFRSNNKYVEIVSDMVASRTVWHYQDNDVFVSSTSQRAIILFLRSFEFNHAVIPWMIANGSLGPGHSWDKRLQVLKGDSSLTLDRSSWTLTIKSAECKFNPVRKSEKEHEERLKNALRDTFELMDLDYSKWVLPLSGGNDSRFILCMLKDVGKLKSVTWGLNSSQFKEENDAFIAKELAGYFGIDHKHLATDITDEPIEALLNRFLVCGEGRVDRISAFMDGFKIWKMFFEEGIEGVIRGDHVFGSKPVSSLLDVRLSLGLALLSDFANLENVPHLGIGHQDVPNWLDKKENESLASWRDRVYHEFRLPVVMAALSDFKASYVEIINPLLTKRIISVVRELPDDLRTGKKLFRKIVASISPNIPYARYDAIDSIENILRNRRVVAAIEKTLCTEYAKSVLPGEFVAYILDRKQVFQAGTTRKKHTIRSYGKRFLPEVVRSKLRGTIAKPSVGFNRLALRAYIICQMHRMLADDATTLAGKHFRP